MVTFYGSLNMYAFLTLPVQFNLLLQAQKLWLQNTIKKMLLKTGIY